MFDAHRVSDGTYSHLFNSNACVYLLGTMLEACALASPDTLILAKLNLFYDEQIIMLLND